VLRHWKEKAHGRKTIGFTSTLAHAQGRRQPAAWVSEGDVQTNAVEEQAQPLAGFQIYALRQYFGGTLKRRQYMTKERIAVVWAIFAILFGALGVGHYQLAQQNAPHFVLPVRPLANVGSVQILGMDLDAPIKMFASSFNEYVDAQNESSRRQNLASLVGYVAACLTSIFSFFLEIMPRRLTIQMNNGNSLHSDKERPGRAGNQAIDEPKSPSDFG
jgi:hypothetical protein